MDGASLLGRHLCLFWWSFKFGLLETLSLLAEPPIYFKPSSVIA
jgi:hypothetical protein